MNQINPQNVLGQVAEAVPKDCKENIVVIGSLAAAYAYFGNDKNLAVRTKDVDCLLKPYPDAAEKGEAITRQLRNAGWKPRRMGSHHIPGTSETPDDELPAIRLYPPGIDPEEENAWFLELLVEPESTKEKGKKWSRIIVDDDHFGLPAFRFLSVAAYVPEKIDHLGIYYARPEMMVLANLLEHPEIKPDIISTQFENRDIKRSNKDLGRVLAIGYLAQKSGLKDFRSWSKDWEFALQSCFPYEWESLVKNVGLGLRALLHSDVDMNEAHHTCVYGLLSSFGVEGSELKEVGERILGDAVERLEELLH